MKFTLGVAVGLAAAWAGLAIWQRIPPFPDIDGWEAEINIDPAVFEDPVTAERQAYRDYRAGKITRAEWSAKLMDSMGVSPEGRRSYA